MRLCLTLPLLLLSTAAIAEPSCTNWLLRTNGSYFRTCVGDDGKQYCEKTVDKKIISKTSCI